ncbi:hypothetical protein ACQWHU_26345, partial [Salmonella enterica subsp. enterica serovar Infantis]
EHTFDISYNEDPVMWFFGHVHYNQINIMNASLDNRYTAVAQKEGVCWSADAREVQIQYLISIIRSRLRKTVLATIG